jgi:hypothetical protein
VIQSDHLDGFNIDEWVCALGQCVPDVTPYLDQLLDEALEENLMHFVELNLTVVNEGKLSNSFWPDAPENAARVMSWLNSRRIKQLLYEKFGMVFDDTSD